MQLKKIQEYIQQYKSFLRTRRAYDNLYKWEALKNFQQHWDISAPNLAEMYNNSLHCSQTKRLWKREAYYPKQMMLKFMAMESDYIQLMFKDLFNEDKDIEGRIDRFIFYCDNALQEFKEANPRSIENNHHHDDNYQIISLYLGFRYPEQYTMYDYEGFKNLLIKLGSRDIPKVNDIGRFFKIMRTLYKMMQKDEELMQLHRRRLHPDKHYQGDSLLLVEEFYKTIR